MSDFQYNANRIFGLDLLRSKAILLVLCSHILWIYPENNSFVSSLFKQFGFWGVELFFVLSGFLIGKILLELYLKEDFTIQSVFYFLKRRWLRTLPNYFLVLILNVIIGVYFQFDLSEIWKYFLFLQNFACSMPKIFPESWSLSVEEFAYLLTPIFLLCFQYLFKIKDKSLQFLINIIVLILFFVSTKLIYNFSVQESTMTGWNDNLKSVVIYRIDSILIGILAAWIHLKRPNFWMKYKVEMMFIGFLLLSFLFLGLGKFNLRIENSIIFWNVIYIPLTSIAFALFLPFCEQFRVAPFWLKKPIVFISKVSYSVYLIHYSLVLFLMKSLIDTTNFSLTQLNCFTVGYLFVTFFLSHLLYRFYEKPIMDLRDKSS